MTTVYEKDVKDGAQKALPRAFFMHVLLPAPYIALAPGGKCGLQCMSFVPASNHDSDHDSYAKCRPTLTHTNVVCGIGSAASALSTEPTHVLHWKLAVALFKHEQT